jgi:FTR1 family protein
VLSILAVGFVTSMILWMARATRSISGELRSQIDKAAEGNGGRLMVAMFAVGREGLKTALFLWAAAQAITPWTIPQRHAAARGGAGHRDGGPARLPDVSRRAADHAGHPVVG